MLESLTRPVLFAYTFISLVRNPNQLDKVFDLIDRIGDDELPPEFLAEPAVRAFLDRPYHPMYIDLDDLAKRPEGTLGRVYADWSRARGLSPQSLRRTDGDDERSRFKDHAASTHDIWHVVTGFDTDVAGEAGLQAFYAAQLGGPVPHLLLSGVFLNTALYAMQDRARRMEATVRGWLLGKRCRPLFGTDWTALWDTPIEEVRRRFGIDNAEHAIANLSQSAA